MILTASSHQTVTILKVETASFGLYFLIQFSVVMQKFYHCIDSLKSIINTKQVSVAAPNCDFFLAWGDVKCGKDEISPFP